MVGQTVHPDIPNEATLQAYGAYVESDESDDESIFSINSLPNLSGSSDDESSDDDAGSVHNLTDDKLETPTNIEPSESAWKIISNEGSTPLADAAAFTKSPVRAQKRLSLRFFLLRSGLWVANSASRHDIRRDAARVAHRASSASRYE